MSSFGMSFLDELLKVAAVATAKKIEMAPTPLEMENKMMQDYIDNVNLKVQKEQAEQAVQAMEQQKAMQQQQQMMQQQQQAQQQGAQQGGAPANPQEALAEGQ